MVFPYCETKQTRNPSHLAEDDLFGGVVVHILAQLGDDLGISVRLKLLSMLDLQSQTQCLVNFVATIPIQD